MILFATLPGEIPQAFLMVKLPPFLVVHRFPNFRLKFKLGGLLLCLVFLLNLQPQLGFPPVKRNVVFAEITQEQTVAVEASPVIFQLPHPGYITTHFSSYHPGIDLCSGLGMPIKPIAKGKIVEAGYNFFGFGLMVEVEHENGYRSLYAHMGKIFVTKGQEVSADNFLGEIGMTGHTSGPHTHLEVSKDGKKVDPLLILPEIRTYPKEDDFAVTKSSTPSAVVVPKATPVSSESAKIIETLPAATPAPSIVPVKTEAESLLDKATEEVAPAEKVDLKQQAVTNILSLASPKPVSSPLPQGGKLSLKNFSLFGFKK